MCRSESLAVHKTTPASKPKPLLNIFMKVGSQSKLNVSTPESTPNKSDDSGSKGSPKGQGSQGQSWRQTIFNRIHMTGNGGAGSPQPSHKTRQSSDTSYEMNAIICRKKRSREEIRELWRSAIRQQIILNKMDKQNQRLKGGTYDKRMKLDYDEIPNFSDATQLWDATKHWDGIVSDHRTHTHTPVSYDRLLKAIQLGVPRHKKGEIWLFLSQHYKCVKNTKDNDSPNADTPYRQLLGQLATQQHAILVDLGECYTSL
ncbi:unnamed protein product [Oppiella nova]|uniref:DUF3350 domain-containing protein n=1 Tax=Oppiella nova TaxID=334625 RepID=A0A7R9MKJ4_9ACAR|nr:unnamed protein product [Oppiella nova]CAG2179086.1 unnamed protein product [Oppiella nova]